MEFVQVNEILQFAAVIAPLASGLTEGVKRTFPTLPKQYLPFISIALGALIGCFYPIDMGIAEKIIGGAVSGLAAVGGFEAFIKNLPKSLPKLPKRQ